MNKEVSYCTKYRSRISAYMYFEKYTVIDKSIVTATDNFKNDFARDRSEQTKLIVSQS